MIIMDPVFPVIKEEYEYPSPSTSWRESSGGSVRGAVEPPRPMEGLHDAGPPPFLTKTFDMVDDLSIDGIVSWSRGGQSFVVWDPHAFSTTVLPRSFKHNNFSSFVRQLNTYGFRKIDPDKWEFANEAFLRGQKHLLRNIRRRKTLSSPSTSSSSPLPLPPNQATVGPCVELGRFGLDAEIDSLRRDKHVLMMELIKLRQQQQNTRAYLQQMELRIQGTERRQQQMMSFLARAMQNPDFINQLVIQKEKRKELEDAVTKKRRRPIEYAQSSCSSQGNNIIKIEPLEFGDQFEVSELEALALEMQGFGRARRDRENGAEDAEELDQLGSYDKELDEGFWQDLLNEGFDREVELHKDDDEEDDEEAVENVCVLADRLGFLGSSPK